MVIKNEEAKTTKLYAVTEDKELYSYELQQNDDGTYHIEVTNLFPIYKFDSNFEWKIDIKNKYFLCKQIHFYFWIYLAIFIS